jgi:hypothetical protein
MAENKQNNQNNEEEVYSGKEFSKAYKNVENSCNKIRRDIDNVQDPFTGIIVLQELKKEYDALVPFMKKVYSECPQDRERLSVRKDEIHKAINELYEHAFKKVESFGVAPVDKNKSPLPKSLEKMTFPENN